MRAQKTVCYEKKQQQEQQQLKHYATLIYVTHALLRPMNYMS
jgi:hypothetical protein